MNSLSCPESSMYEVKQDPKAMFLVFRPQRAQGRRRLLFESRRAKILAHARRMIAEKGYDGVAIRTLAERSGVTPPTIYNLVGGRDEVMQSAVFELLQAKIDYAYRLAEVRNINGIFAYGEILWQFLVRDPAYSRQLIYECFNSDRHQKLLHDLNECNEGALVAWLEALRDKGKIRSTFRREMVVEVVLRHLSMAVLSWAENHHQVDMLRTDILSGIILILSAFVDDKETVKMQRWLASPAVTNPLSL